MCHPIRKDNNIACHYQNSTFKRDNLKFSEDKFNTPAAQWHLGSVHTS